MTFRRRLLLTSMATLVVGLGALLVLGNVLLAQRVHAETSSVLRANADSQVSALHVSADGVRVRETANDASLDNRGWVLDGRKLIEQPPDASPALDALAVRLGRAGRQTEVDGPDDTRLRVEPIRAAGDDRAVGAVVVVSSTESLEHLQKAVLLGSVVIAALVLLAGGLAIRSAVNGALRPVAHMTETAQNWSAHDLERRFDLGPARDELTALAETLDGLLSRIAASRRHEQRFAGEVAHELRTPLAGLKAHAELALRATSDTADAGRREALEGIVAQADRLSQAIDTLLAMARQELDPSEGSVDLEALAAEIDDVEVVRSPVVMPHAEGDPDVVRRALAPLIDNARRHARTGVRLELTTAHGHVRLAVCDDGPGIDPALGDRVFDPGVRGADDAQGAGLGLPLARRLARSCGGDVRLEAAQGGRFVLDLPALGPPGAG
jgi:signal transduction histidine kinase